MSSSAWHAVVVLVCVVLAPFPKTDRIGLNLFVSYFVILFSMDFDQGSCCHGGKKEKKKEESKKTETLSDMLFSWDGSSSLDDAWLGPCSHSNQ